MITTEEHVAAPPASVFAVVADARWYPEWLVGAKRIRRIDEAWPAPGSTFEHTVGAGPFRLRGSTSVLAAERPHALELRAGIGPLGAARVRFEIDPADDGSRLTIHEEPEQGLFRLLWSTPGRRLLALGLWGRNAISIRALRDRIEDGAVDR